MDFSIKAIGFQLIEFLKKKKKVLICSIQHTTIKADKAKTNTNSIQFTASNFSLSLSIFVSQEHGKETCQVLCGTLSLSL